MPLVSPVAGVATICVLLAFSAFFSGSEIALFSLDRHRLGVLLERAGPRAAALERLRDDPHRLLVTILVGNNVVNIAMASVATVVLADAFSPGVALVGSTVGMSAVVLLFGEIVPKAYGVSHAESLSLRVARPIRFVQWVLYPLVGFFDAVSGAINRVTGGDADIERPYVTREEIAALLRTGERVGAIEEAEHDMVEAVFELGSTTAREVMVPRVDVVAVDVETSLEDVLETCAAHRLTRLPVYEGTVDSVVGIADIRDVERALREGTRLGDVLLPAVQVPDTIRVDDLLARMQTERVTMVVVRDEFGEVEGIVTVEDILEQIVGDIFEVGEERLLHPAPDGLVVRGEVTVGEVNDVLDADLPRSGEFETVAGLVNDRLGRIGRVGDRVELAGLALTVEAVERNRIRRVRVSHLDSDREGVDSGREGETS